MSLPSSLRRFMLPLAVAVAILVLPLAAARPAAACSCEPESDELRLDDAVAVFSGEVTGHEEVSVDPMRPGRAVAIWTFTVSRVFKGTIGPTVRVASSSLSSAFCGIDLPPTGPALVFTQVRGDLEPPVAGVGLTANSCNGTRSLVDSPIPPAFGEGTDPGAPPPAPTAGLSTKPPALPWAAVGGITAAVALAAGLFFVRRRARRPSAP